MIKQMNALLWLQVPEKSFVRIARIPVVDEASKRLPIPLGPYEALQRSPVTIYY